MIPKVIHQFWVGEEIPERFHDLHLSIVGTNPDFEVILWRDKEIAESICPPSMYDLNPPQKSSCVDVIKLHALKKFGGIVLDLDFKGIRSFSPVIENDAFACRQPDGRACNAVYGSVAGHPWIDRMLADDRHKWCSPNCCYIMEPAMQGDVFIGPTDWFFPYNFNEEPKPPTKNTIAIHLWEGSWLHE